MTMRLLAILLVTVSLYSCVMPSSTVDLYGLYKKYVDTVEIDKTPFVEELLVGSLREEINVGDKDAFPVLSGFPGVLSQTSSYYQTVKQNKGCLTVNGYDESLSPISLHIEYTYENNKWLLAFVEIFYLETEKDFESIGICPTRS